MVFFPRCSLASSLDYQKSIQDLWHPCQPERRCQKTSICKNDSTLSGITGFSHRRKATTTRLLRLDPSSKHNIDRLSTRWARKAGGANATPQHSTPNAQLLFPHQTASGTKHSFRLQRTLIKRISGQAASWNVRDMNKPRHGIAGGSKASGSDTSSKRRLRPLSSPQQCLTAEEGFGTTCSLRK